MIPKFTNDLFRDLYDLQIVPLNVQAISFVSRPFNYRLTESLPTSTSVQLPQLTQIQGLRLCWLTVVPVGSYLYVFRYRRYHSRVPGYRGTGVPMWVPGYTLYLGIVETVESTVSTICIPGRYLTVRLYSYL